MAALRGGVTTPEMRTPPRRSATIRRNAEQVRVPMGFIKGTMVLTKGVFFFFSLGRQMRRGCYYLGRMNTSRVNLYPTSVGQHRTPPHSRNYENLAQNLG